MKASEYMRSRVWHGFIDDTAAAFCIPYIGADQVMWGSDFPHTRSMGLEVHTELGDLLESMTKEDQQKVVSASAAKLFNWSKE
jgi:predicted TIM-barrel fold metal-dependent hydrolase